MKTVQAASTAGLLCRGALPVLAMGAELHCRAPLRLSATSLLPATLSTLTAARAPESPAATEVALPRHTAGLEERLALVEKLKSRAPVLALRPYKLPSELPTKTLPRTTAGELPTAPRVAKDHSRAPVLALSALSCLSLEPKKSLPLPSEAALLSTGPPVGKLHSRAPVPLRHLSCPSELPMTLL
jgi:hypothetical protein